MHESTFDIMQRLANKYLDKNESLRILDIGSSDVNGTYRAIFQNPSWQYVGLDIEPGKNVDIVAKGLYDYGVEEEYDVVITGQCGEHVEDIYTWIKQVAKAAKKDAFVFVVIPCSWPEHRHPVDCWRVYPDGMRFLLSKVAGLQVIDVFKHEFRFENNTLGDCVGVARKI